MISHFPSFGVPVAHMLFKIELLIEDNSKISCMGTRGAVERDIYLGEGVFIFSSKELDLYFIRIKRGAHSHAEVRKLLVIGLYRRD